jgi:hypothetical protein
VVASSEEAMRGMGTYLSECTFSDAAQEEEMKEVDFAVKVDGLSTNQCVSYAASHSLD